MGYEIYITRRKNWYDFGPPEISLREWIHATRKYRDLISKGGGQRQWKAYFPFRS
jgi:hypothetical protein